MKGLPDCPDCGAPCQLVEVKASSRQEDRLPYWRCPWTAPRAELDLSVVEGEIIDSCRKPYRRPKEYGGPAGRFTGH